MIIVSDTSVITNLAAIGHIQILHQLDDRILIPEAVYQELTHIDPPVPGTLEAQTFTGIERQIVCDRQLVQQLQIQAKLDPGESEAIALALEIDLIYFSLMSVAGEQKLIVEKFGLSVY